MKLFRGIGLAITIILLLSFSGCGRGQAVYNINNQALGISKEKVSLKEVGDTIIRAGVGLGWTMNKVKDGEIIATIALRKHTAKVAITYNTKEYNIKYLDSSNLNYDSTQNTIHKNYNGWIQNLSRAIESQVGLIGI